MLKFYVLTLLVFSAVFGLLVFLNNRYNYKKSKRPMQLFSTVVIILVVFFISLFLSDIINGINAILSIEIVSNIVSFVFGSVPAITLSGMVLAILLLNLFVLIGGLIIKKLCYFVLSFFRIPRGKYNPFAIIIRTFYNTEIGYITKPNAMLYRKWLCWAKYCVLGLFSIMSIALLTLVFFYPDWMMKESDFTAKVVLYLYWFSMATYLIINEMYYFLKGFDEDEASREYDTEDIPGIIVGDYVKLFDVYQNMAKDANLIRAYKFEDFASRRLFNGGSSANSDMCAPELRPVYEMIENKIRCTGVDICDEYANALANMINGKDVFVADSIIGEISQYLFNYLNYRLCCGNKVIIFCSMDIYEDKNKCRSFMEMIKKVFAKANGYGAIWQIGTYSDILNNEPVDVLVSSYNSFINDYSNRAETGFFDNVKICVCSDSLELFSEEQFYKKALFSHFDNTGTDIQYIFLSENNSVMLKNAVEDMLGEKHPVSFFKNSNQINDSFIFFWRGESYYKPQIVFDTDSKYYYGNALPLGIIAAKYGVEKVNIIDCENTPFRTYHRMMKDRAAEIEKGIKRNVNFDSVFSYEFVNYYVGEDLIFLIVHDKYNNAAICMDVWGKIADNKIKILHIVSEPYMLREFLCENITDTQFAEAVVPFNSKLFIKSEAETMIINMYEFGVKASEILSVRRHLEFDSETVSISEILKKLFMIVFPNEYAGDYIKSFSFENDMRYSSARRCYDNENLVRFINKTLYKKLLSKDDYAKIIINNKDEFKYLPILKEDIHNYCLEDQFISLDGESVLISSMENGLITGKIQNETNHYEYVPVCSFSSKNFKLINDDNSLEAPYFVEYGVADVRREIKDYYSLIRGRDLTVSTNCIKHSMNRNLLVVDEIKNAQMLIVHFNYGFSDNAKAALLIAELLNGLFKTIFPTLYKNIFACANTESISINGDTEIKKDDTIEEIPDKPDAAVESKILEMVPCETSIKGSECIVTIYEFCHKELGMVQELKTRFDEIILPIQRYIDWELSKKENTALYFKYGFKEYSELLPIEEVKNFFDSIVPKNIAVSGYHDNLNPKEWTHCDYCFRPIILSAHRLKDNRLMCNDCFCQKKKTKQEIEDLFHEVIVKMNRNYAMEIVKRNSEDEVTISVKFKSRYTINKKINNPSPYAVVLGFYSSGDRELWVERGGPAPAVFAVLAHELTHAWQHDELDFKPPRSLVDKKVRIEGIKDPVYIRDIHIWEGQASYVEIEMMRVVNQHDYADHIEREILSRSDDDIYKIGYLYFVQLMKNCNTNNVFEFLISESRGLL